MNKPTILSACAVSMALGCSGADPTVTQSDLATTAPPPVADMQPQALKTPTGEDRCGNFAPYKQVFFGDLHTHTMLSADAYGMGTRSDPYDAYRFARGLESISIASGSPTPAAPKHIDVPLDFDAVTDHSEWLAATYGCETSPDGTAFDPSSPMHACNVFLNEGNAGVAAIAGGTAVLAASCHAADMGPGEEHTADCLAVTQSAWQYEQAAADANNVRCAFTTFKAYEWTAEGTGSSGGTLHKNVVFGGEQVPDRPYDFLDYPLATDLWSALDVGCSGGCVALTIPHNSNMSNGTAFAVPSTATGVQQIEKYQKLVEIYQHKGASECLNATGASVDPDCDFEQLTPAKDDTPSPQSYVRNALEQGLVDYAAGPAAGRSDPLMLGIVAATDDHNAMPGNVDETSFNGHLGLMDDTASDRLTTASDFGPGGITGVWAYQNTRQAIFDSLQKRETFGTSGPRIAVRMFETWSGTDYCANGGVPAQLLTDGATAMGSQMPVTPPGGAASPWFIVSALKDKTDIQEVDIVKGTIVDGKLVESIQRWKVTDPMPISASAPCVRWQDTTYSASAPSFYYARILQKASPRWTQSSCAEATAAGTAVVGCGPNGSLSTATIQERAWTSPIWALP